MERPWRSVADAAHPAQRVGDAGVRDHDRPGVPECCALSVEPPGPEKESASQELEHFADGLLPPSRRRKPRSERLALREPLLPEPLRLQRDAGVGRDLRMQRPARASLPVPVLLPRFHDACESRLEVPRRVRVFHAPTGRECERPDRR